MNITLFEIPTRKAFERYDFCVEFKLVPDGAFKIFESDSKHTLSSFQQHIICKLITTFGQNYCYTFCSNDQSKMYLLIRVSNKCVKSLAKETQLQLLLANKKCEEVAAEGDSSSDIAPLTVAHIPEVTPITPYQFIYGPYVDNAYMQALYARPFPSKTIFTKNLRIKLMTLKYIIEIVAIRRISETDNILNLKYLQNANIINDFYPIHETKALAITSNKWFKFCANVPLNDIKDYFGERIGLYFAFLGFLSSSLWIPSLMGLAFQIFRNLQDISSITSTQTFHPSIVPAIICGLWIIFINCIWRSYQSILSMRWNTIGQSKTDRESDQNRFHYYGFRIHSYIDGHEYLYFHFYSKIAVQISSFLASAAFIILIWSSILGVYYARFLLRNYLVGYYIQWVASGMNYIMIVLFNSMIMPFGIQLNDLENHRTEYLYHNALTAKVFIFTFLNYFTSSYYLAFLGLQTPTYLYSSRDPDGLCGYNSCADVVAINLATFLFLEVVMMNIIRYGYRFFNWFYCTPRARRRHLFMDREDDAGDDNHQERSMERNVNDSLDSWLASDVQHAHRGNGDDEEDGFHGDDDHLYTKGKAIKKSQIDAMSDSTSPRNLGMERKEGQRPLLMLERLYFKKGKEEAKKNVDMLSDVDESFTMQPSHDMEAAVVVTETTDIKDEEKEVPEWDHSVVSGNQYESYQLPQDEFNRQPPRRSCLTRCLCGEDLPPIQTNRRSSAYVDVEEDCCFCELCGVQFRLSNCQPSDQPNGLMDELYLSYDHTIDSIRDYNRIFLYIVFISVFGVVLPGGIPAAMVGIIIELYGKGWMLANICKRPIPLSAETIGDSWLKILELITFIAIITNGCLLAFTVDVFSFNEHNLDDDNTMSWRLMILIVYILGMLTLHYLAINLNPEVPDVVKIQMKRSDYIVRKLILKEPDSSQTFHLDIL